MHFRHSLGSSSSLQIAQQLKEKNLAMNHFVEFLHSTGLWARVRNKLLMVRKMKLVNIFDMETCSSKFFS